MKLEFGSPSVHVRTGKVGARVQVSVHQEHGWNGHYEFDTHGMSQQDVVAKVQAIQDHHRKKAVRLDGFVSSVLGAAFVLNSRHFKIVDCTVWERAGEVELYIDAREVIGSREIGVEGLPMTRRVQTIDDVPDNGSIMALILDAVQRKVTIDQAHADYTAGVQAMMLAAGVGNVP